MILNKVRAFLLGVQDGWRQPFDLSSSHNVEHLGSREDFMVQEWLDRGTIVGQVLRAPIRHQKAGE